MAVARVRARHPITQAMLAVTHGGALAKATAVALPGEISVPTHMQTVTSAGTTPSQNVAVASAAVASNPAAASNPAVTPAGLAGSVDFGSVTGSVSGKWMMWAAIAVGAYLILRKR